MDIIQGFFTAFGLFFLFVVIGIILLIRFVIKRSKADQPAHVLEKEKRELFEKARSKRGRLLPWKPEYIERISNDLNFSYVKGMTRKFNGSIKNLDGDRLITFRRSDRGVNITTSKIVAMGSNFEVFFDQREEEVTIHFNSTYLGKMIRHEQLLDDNDRVIGTTDRNENAEDYYHIHLKNKRIAYVVKNTERRNLLQNPFYAFPHSSRYKEDIWVENKTSNCELVRLYEELNPLEYNWILALVIYEAVYYGIDFAQ